MIILTAVKQAQGHVTNFSTEMVQLIIKWNYEVVNWKERKLKPMLNSVWERTIDHEKNNSCSSIEVFKHHHWNKIISQNISLDVILRTICLGQSYEKSFHNWQFGCKSQSLMSTISLIARESWWKTSIHTKMWCCTESPSNPLTLIFISSLKHDYWVGGRVGGCHFCPSTYYW